MFFNFCKFFYNKPVLFLIRKKVTLKRNRASVNSMKRSAVKLRKNERQKKKKKNGHQSHNRCAAKSDPDESVIN